MKLTLMSQTSMVFASTFMVLRYNIILLIILQTIHKFLPTSSSLYNKLFSLGDHAEAFNAHIHHDADARDK